IAGGPNPGGTDGPGSQATLSDPVNLDFGPGGMLYVCDYGNARIRAIAPDFTVTTVLRNQQTPFGIVGTSSVLYNQTDNTGSIWSVDVSAGSATMLATGYGQARGLALLADGTIAFSDATQDVILRLDPSTGAVTLIAGQLNMRGFQDGSGAA